MYGRCMHMFSTHVKSLLGFLPTTTKINHVPVSIWATEESTQEMGGWVSGGLDDYPLPKASFSIRFSCMLQEQNNSLCRVLSSPPYSPYPKTQSRGLGPNT